MALINKIKNRLRIAYATGTIFKIDGQKMAQAKVVAPRATACTDLTFLNALHAQYWGVQFSVHATFDQVMIVNNAPSLRTGMGNNQTINSLTFEQIRSLFPDILSLQEVAIRYGQRLHFFIELNTVLSSGYLAQILKHLCAGKDYHLTTVSEPVATALLSHFPKESILLKAKRKNILKFT